MLTIGSLQAQNYNQYQLLKTEGAIPNEFRVSSTEKYESNIKDIDKADSKRTRKDKQDFFLESNFELDELLHSGLVLFNDPVTVYLNEVAQKLAVNNPKLQSVRVYALRISAVNAFATDRGNVFVSIGLLAQLKDEAQLAFILSHELTHMEEGHNIQLFLKGKDISRNKEKSSVLRERTYDKSVLEKHSYSKELETEADDKGFQRLVQQTQYSTQTLNNVFDILKFSYLPFDNVPFEKSFFEGGDYILPKEYFLDTVKQIKGEDEAEDDTESSHPNIAKRRDAFNKAVKKVDETGRSIYLVSKERFENLRQVCRYELCMIYLHNDNCSKAIYSAYLLLKDNPESLYLKKIIAKALYILAKDHNNSSAIRSNSYKEVEGELQRVVYLLSSIDDRDLNVLALRYNYNLWKANFKDTELAAMTKDLLLELMIHVESLDFFQNDKSLTNTVTTPAVPMKENTPKEETNGNTKKGAQKETKRERVVFESDFSDTDSKEAIDTVTIDHDYLKYAFIGQVKDTLLVNSFNKALAQYKENKERDAYYQTSEGRRAYKKEARNDKKNGVALGIDKIVIINPFYTKIEARRVGYNQTYKLKYLEGELGEAKLFDVITTSAKESGIDYEVLDINRLTENESAKFNDITALNDWFSEQVNHDYLSLTTGYNQALIDSIARKYGTDYFLWSGVLSVHKKSSANAGLIWAIVPVFPIILPYAIAITAQRKNETLIYSVLYDVKTGRNRVINYTYIKRPTRDVILKSQFYDTFLQIKRSSLKDKKTK